jgi:hypothetical protein
MQVAMKVHAALELAAEGFRVFPCHTMIEDRCSCGSDNCESPAKHPRTPHGCKDATSDSVKIRELWRYCPEANVAVATGNGLMVIDIDGPEAQAALDAQASEHGEQLPTTRAVRTGRHGGRHLWLRTKPDLGLANSSGRLAKGIDTRGEGGYVLTPPSSHPAGRAYEWETPGAPVAPAPGWVVARLTGPRAPRTSGDRQAQAQAQIPADDAWRRRIEGLGRQQLSATLTELHAHSTELGSGRGTALYAAAARLGRIVASGGLDLQATWRDLEIAGHRLGLGTEELERSIERGLAEGMSQPVELVNRPYGRELNRREPRAMLDRAGGAAELIPPANGNGNGSRATWPEPQPLDTPRSLPSLPIDRFPPVLAGWIAEAATESQTPPELAAGIALAALSTIALPLGPIHVRQGWQEELPIFVLVALPPSERKSAVLRRALEPLREVERQRRLDARESIAQARAEIAQLEGMKARIRSDLAKAANSKELESLRDQLADVEGKLDERPEPSEPRLLADDATPEALAGLLARHQRLGVISAESALIDNLAGFYNEGRANLHLVCKAFSGEEAHIDRRSRPTEHLPRPLLALGFAVQPHVLDAMRGNRAMIAQGFAARFIYLLPESRLGHRQRRPPAMSDSTASDYRRLLRHLADLADSCVAVTTVTNGDKNTPERILSPFVTGFPGDGIRLSGEALDLLEERDARLEPEFLPDGELSSDRAQGWGGKHIGRCIRLAALFHLATFRSPEKEIQADTLENAFVVGDALIPHALRALGATAEEQLRKPVEAALRWIRETRRSELSARDLQRGPYVLKDSAPLCQRVLERLAELGWARRLSEPSTPSPGPGRPASPAYEVHPRLRPDHD